MNYFKGNVRQKYLTDPIVYNAEYYRERYSDLKAAFGNDDDALLNHWLTAGINEGRVASPVFSVTYYFNHNGDVKEAYNGEYSGAAEHFIRCGVDEGRPSSDEFALWDYKKNGSMQNPGGKYRRLL